MCENVSSRGLHRVSGRTDPEDKDFPVEASLVSGDSRGWRAAIPGSQTIHLVFVQPQGLRSISVVFEETEAERTQEFVLRWSHG
jgi:hypothetical protein